jgi:C4-dicarboxylate-specific signal transduction histidine kinase
VERLNASVSGVLQLSRSEDSPREVVSLHHLVEEAADLLASKFRRQGVGLSLDLDAEADRILARVGQVKSAVLNLMVNALEAQPNGGAWRSGPSSLGFPRWGARGGPALPGQARGPAEIRDRIFEPFFTTKPGGSGIGLAMASQAVRANGGELSWSPPSWWKGLGFRGGVSPGGPGGHHGGVPVRASPEVRTGSFVSARGRDQTRIRRRPGGTRRRGARRSGFRPTS